MRPIITQSSNCLESTARGLVAGASRPSRAPTWASPSAKIPKLTSVPHSTSYPCPSEIHRFGSITNFVKLLGPPEYLKNNQGISSSDTVMDMEQDLSSYFDNLLLPPTAVCDVSSRRSSYLPTQDGYNLDRRKPTHHPPPNYPIQRTVRPAHNRATMALESRKPALES